MGDRLATTDMAKNWAGWLCPLWEGELGLHVIQSGLGRCLSSYRMALDPSSRSATTDMGRNLSGGTVTLGMELGQHPTQLP